MGRPVRLSSRLMERKKLSLNHFGYVRNSAINHGATDVWLMNLRLNSEKKLLIKNAYAKCRLLLTVSHKSVDQGDRFMLNKYDRIRNGTVFIEPVSRG